MFYEADIKVDAILSFPWLFENRIGIFPHLKCLAVLEPELSLLFGTRRPRGRKKGRGVSAQSINQVGADNEIMSSSTHDRVDPTPLVQNIATEPAGEEEKLRIFLSKLHLHLPPRV